MKTNKGGLAQLVAVSDNLVIITAAAVLALTERVARVSTSGASYTVTLPNVSEAAGMMFSVYMTVQTGIFTVTVQDNNESNNWTDLVLNADDDHALLYSNGFEWLTVDSTITP